MTIALHHAAICTTDVERSLAFWRDGIGLTQQFDLAFEGDWRTLFGSETNDLRSIFLGDPDAPDAGLVELVVFDGAGPRPTATPGPHAGFFLLSFARDVDDTLQRLARLGLDDDVRRIDQPVPDGTSVPMAVVTAPDGVLVELIGTLERP